MSGVQEKLFVGIAGLIGAGKSTLAAALAREMGLPAFFEPVDANVYLADFYKDMRRHGFAMQIYLLSERFRQHQQVIWRGEGGVQDRTIYEDSIFAQILRDGGSMDERDYQTYCTLFGHMSNFMRKPNLIVYLRVTPEESLARIRARGRAAEAAVTIEYLRGLHAAYEAFIEGISRVIPVIRVDWSTFRTAEVMARVIREEWSRMRVISDAAF